ncbi:uncharacterized protein EAF01_002934 [Botrytis porri]|nr:uncharacterized protein EAF01_002934 [Botrytis porri]KAF7911427.1 hypothetical protein EAF01_002934 [Botrytis porri]
MALECTVQTSTDSQKQSQDLDSDDSFDPNSLPVRSIPHTL